MQIINRFKSFGLRKKIVIAAMAFCLIAMALAGLDAWVG